MYTWAGVPPKPLLSPSLAVPVFHCMVFKVVYCEWMLSVCNQDCLKGVGLLHRKMKKELHYHINKNWIWVLEIDIEYHDINDNLWTFWPTAIKSNSLPLCYKYPRGFKAKKLGKIGPDVESGSVHQISFSAFSVPYSSSVYCINIGPKWRYHPCIVSDGERIWSKRCYRT